MSPTKTDVPIAHVVYLFYVTIFITIKFSSNAFLELKSVGPNDPALDGDPALPGNGAFNVGFAGDQVSMNKKVDAVMKASLQRRCGPLPNYFVIILVISLVIFKPRCICTTISDIFSNADDSLFKTILKNSYHGLYPYLPENQYQHYHLRQRLYNRALIPKTTYFSDRDYIMRMLYKNCY